MRHDPLRARLPQPQRKEFGRLRNCFAVLCTVPTTHARANTQNAGPGRAEVIELGFGALTVPAWAARIWSHALPAAGGIGFTRRSSPKGP